MIGAFARMLGSRDRLLTVEEKDANAYAWKTRTPEGGERGADGSDAPPEAFSERIEHEGGDVFVVPMLETLRRVLRARLGRTEPESLSGVSENP